ncbi:MAG: hypothetical protein GX657_02110 [Chloroflexi bacterium]|nr:hypothetical protein [Chloroflexota bacterium]
MDETGTRGYLAYMLRLRRTDGAHPAWRPSLEAVATGERHVFSTLEEMTDWLRAEVGEAADQSASVVASAPGETDPGATG